MNSLQNFLMFLNENFVSILVCIGLVIGLIQKVKSFFSKSDDEKIEIAKRQIQETILKMVSDAEVDYEEWNKAGSIKRAQVISQIYDNYPVLSKVVDQTALIEWIDDTIDDSLDTLRDIVGSNK